MTQEYALDKAYDLFGTGAHVGYGVIGRRDYNVYYVGKRVCGDWKILGVGETFEEAFTNAKEVK